MNYPRCTIPWCAIGANDGKGSNATTRLCDQCRRDPANIGWCETQDSDVPLDIDTVLDRALHRVGFHVSDLQEQPVRAESEKVRQIIELVTFGEREEYVYVDARGRRRGTRVRRRDLSLREVAARVGCHYSYVSRVCRRFTQ